MKDIIHYEIKNEKVSLNDLTEEDKTVQMLMLINKSNVSQEQKNFLAKAAYRFMDFNYSKIAEYYVNQNEEMQKLMETLGLVVIDYDNAIKKGYEDFVNTVNELCKGNKDE